MSFTTQPSGSATEAADESNVEHSALWTGWMENSGREIKVKRELEPQRQMGKKEGRDLMFQGEGVGGERRKEDEVWKGRRPGGRPAGSKVRVGQSRSLVACLLQSPESKVSHRDDLEQRETGD